jgi:hypothetical protein
VTAYADTQDLETLAADLDFRLTGDEDFRSRLLDQAARDLDAQVLGISYEGELDELTEEQRDGLRRATTAQALFRSEMQGEWALGIDDGLASVGSLSFWRLPQPRISPAATEAVSGLGLIARRLCASPTLDPREVDGPTD